MHIQIAVERVDKHSWWDNRHQLSRIRLIIRNIQQQNRLLQERDGRGWSGVPVASGDDVLS